MSQETVKSDLLSLVALAHERAILEGTDYGIHVSQGANAYWLVRKTDEKISGQWGQIRHLPTAMKFKGPDTSIAFYPDGTASETVIVFESPDHPCLSINAFTGKGRWYETS